MNKVMQGIRVLEVAQRTFVPSAGAILGMELSRTDSFVTFLLGTVSRFRTSAAAGRLPSCGARARRRLSGGRGRKREPKSGLA